MTTFGYNTSHAMQPAEPDVNDSQAGISLSRLPYDDSAWRILLRADNGEFGGALEFYTDVATLKEFGLQLADFPFSRADEVRYELGDRDGSWAYYLLLRAFTYDRLGHISLEVAMDNCEKDHHHAQASFFIFCEAAALNQLGRRISAWAANTDEPLVWFAGG